jgi:hypothetical protein
VTETEKTLDQDSKREDPECRSETLMLEPICLAKIVITFTNSVAILQLTAHKTGDFTKQTLEFATDDW